MYESIVRDSKQLAFYDPGVGTFSPFGRTIGRCAGILLGKAIALGLQENIEDAYRYLMDNYEKGDRVFLFGFSRGAYSVRALAGMLHKCGLLQKGHNNLILYASKIYHRRHNENIAIGFKQTYSNECKPHFIGVWDTVGSVGWSWPFRKKFRNTILNKDVPYGYQAISVDERRRFYRANLWHEPEKNERQTIEQVWFPGFHSDVGGSDAGRRVSDITLKWMLENAMDKGLRLTEGWIGNLNPDPLGQINESWTYLWRILPPAVRHIPEGAKIHASVVRRMENPANHYQPRNLPTRRRKVQ